MAIIKYPLVFGSRDEAVVMLISRWRLTQDVTERNAFLSTFRFLAILEQYSEDNDIHALAERLSYPVDLQEDLKIYMQERGIV